MNDNAPFMKGYESIQTEKTEQSCVQKSDIFKMTLMGRSEETCHIYRIRAITFREARDAGATFISRSSVANKLKRPETWVKRNWKRNPYDCEMNTVLSQELRDIIEASAGKQRKSIRKLFYHLYWTANDHSLKVKDII